ncbi:hypothetical protein WA1_05940 [Scytonema hofmannii PCC 7110]|uniref:Uncharacterized protein n=1 Tax=Scytonema hofmannii PCC 7110 TaxID=128403 RepID=A0A139WTQ7_9CYAN|nr:hypothetical protein WA1_05940 [Scytonema hofmannii PCC 7110]
MRINSPHLYLELAEKLRKKHAEGLIRDFQEMNYSSCGTGVPARSILVAGGDARTTRNFGRFFYLEVQGVVAQQELI